VHYIKELYNHFIKEYYKLHEADASHKSYVPLVVNTSGWVKGTSFLFLNLKFC
jgi:polynucleotide 5'-hydroxyl-kinase GRC3/NOL9